ncbi:hypothetical protein AB0M39_20495 [Streptomyces sp. NPDC051907]|uniref:hypothetical protein n=1 Tax=Streptomyces sp. NPDC051907 TaxID=3155284 RepID=UPI003433FAE2
MPGPDFADRIGALLGPAANRPGALAGLPTRQPLRTRNTADAADRPASRPDSAAALRSPTGETATR